MSPLTAIERFFERLFERPSARLFRTHVQPIQIQRRIERAMEAGRRPGAARVLVPNRFVVHLNPEDLEGLAPVAEGLAVELADEALSFARAHRYGLADRPRVDLIADVTVPRADIRVDARMTAPSTGGTGRGTAEAGGVPGLASDDAQDPTATAVFTIPESSTPKATLHVIDPDGRTRDIELPAGGLTIGRANDNGLVAHDVRVSRHHGRIAGRRGTLVYTDLGSTNGSRVNGEPVTEVVLGVGDRLQVGDTTLVVEVDEASG
jgi:hypothetical protein